MKTLPANASFYEVEGYDGERSGTFHVWSNGTVERIRGPLTWKQCCRFFHDPEAPAFVLEAVAKQRAKS